MKIKFEILYDIEKCFRCNFFRQNTGIKDNFFERCRPGKLTNSPHDIDPIIFQIMDQDISDEASCDNAIQDYPSKSKRRSKKERQHSCQMCPFKSADRFEIHNHMKSSHGIENRHQVSWKCHPILFCSLIFFCL